MGWFGAVLTALLAWRLILLEHIVPVKHLGLALVLVGLLGAINARPAFAVTDAERAAARTIGYQGLAAYKKGNYPLALEKFSRAYEVLKVPTLGLWTARALAKQGRLVEAAERYLELTRIEVSGGDEQLQRQAQATAAKERQALMPRIAGLTIQLRGVKPEQAQITLDGKEVPSAFVGEQQPVDPGEHQIKVQAGDQEVEKTATLGEGEKQTLEIELEPIAATEESPGKPTPVTGTSKGDQGAENERPWQKTATWISLGVGGAGLIFGSVTGVIAISKRKSLDDSGCVNQVCPDDQQSKVDSYNGMRTLSTVGFIAGGVGLAAAGAFFLTAPKGANDGKDQVTAWVGVGSAGLSARF